MGNYSTINSQKKRPVCGGCLVPAMLDRDELAIHKEVSAPKGRIILEAMKFLNPKERSLMLASCNNSTEKLQQLLKSGAPADTYDENRTSPLHVACRQGSLEVIKELLDHRAAIDITDCAGWTSLHIAAYSCRTDVVRLLLKHNADATIVNRTGETPWDLANDAATQQEFIKYWKHKAEDTESPKVQCAAKVFYDINAKKAFPRPAQIEKHKKSVVKKWERLGEFRTYLNKEGFEELLDDFCVIFNNNPLVGITLVVLCGIVPQDPEKISKFLFDQSLDPSSIGTLLSNTEDFYVEISKEYLKLFDFNKTNLIQSLRSLMKKVQVSFDHSRTAVLVKYFAQAFWTYSSHFKSEDSVESMALSVLMLDFSLHDPTSSPMSKADFIASASGMHDGEDFSDKYLSWVFTEVKKLSIRPKAQNFIKKPPFNGVKYAGSLAYRCSQEWKERFFVLKSSIFFTFTSNTAPFPVSLIPVQNLSVHFDTRLQQFTLTSGLPFNQYKISQTGLLNVRSTSRVYFKAGNLKLWLEGFQSTPAVKITIV